ncbi:MAG: antiterminator Q family protein [Pseudomonadota bacterium]
MNAHAAQEVLQAWGRSSGGEIPERLWWPNASAFARRMQKPLKRKRDPKLSAGLRLSDDEHLLIDRAVAGLRSNDSTQHTVIIRSYQDGASDTAIARELGLSCQRVTAIRRKAVQSIADQIDAEKIV